MIQRNKSIWNFSKGNSVFKDDEDAAETKDLKEVVEGMVEEEAALNVGGKKWEAK